jgi:hypothetical protein
MKNGIGKRRFKAFPYFPVLWYFYAYKYIGIFIAKRINFKRYYTAFFTRIKNRNFHCKAYQF